MQQLPHGPSPAQVLRDIKDMDPRAAIAALGRLKKSQSNLKTALRWSTRDQDGHAWSEAEIQAAEHQYRTNIDALDFAIDIISVLVQ